jgi:threonine aldolase
MIDLRSDTVTKPTPAMLAAMTAAPVGDDVYGEDPTINRLEEVVADRLGKDAALFVPSGCMGNQIAVRLHCRPGEELIADDRSHVVLWEAGGPAALSGVTVRPYRAADGLPEVADLPAPQPDDPHSPPTRLFWVENTHNRGGGRVVPMARVRELAAWADRHRLPMHLDGARIWNAAVASGTPVKELCRPFTTVQTCFSKGLGAPVGSALAGPKDLIARGRRVRKLFGGAMRQAGILAAACLYALDHHVERLAEDHANAKLIAAAVRDVPGLTLVPAVVETNLVWAEVDPSLGTAKDVAGRLARAGVRVSALGDQTLRAVTHLDVSRADCERAAEAIRRYAAG